MAALPALPIVPTVVLHWYYGYQPRYKTDWRWLEGRQDSPWYPGVLRLFRQERRGDWDEVVARLAGELAAWAADTARDRDAVALEAGVEGEGA